MIYNTEMNSVFCDGMDFIWRQNYYLERISGEWMNDDNSFELSS